MIILSAVFTGLIFALLCFRCRMIPRNNENNAVNRYLSTFRNNIYFFKSFISIRNSDAINDFHAFLLQTGNVTHSQGHNRDRALSPELLSALECFAYNNKHSLDQTGKFHENSHDIASNSVDFAYHKPSDPDLVESIHEGGIESNRASPRLHSRISHEDLKSIYSNNNNNNNELQRVFPSGIHPTLALQPASADSADPSAALLSARSDVTRDEFSCAICLSDYQPLDLLLRLPCAHVYHKSCVSAWFSQHNTCPLCKQNVPLLLQSQNGIAPLAVEANLGSNAPAASAATSSSSSATVGNDRTGGYSPFTTNSRSSAVLPSSQLDIV